MIAELERRLKHGLQTIKVAGSSSARRKPEDGFRFGAVVESALKPGRGL